MKIFDGGFSKQDTLKDLVALPFPTKVMEYDSRINLVYCINI